MVLIDMASRIRKDFRLFTIDTEFLFPETYALMDRIEERYGIAIEKVYSVLSPEEQERAHGAALWGRIPTSAAIFAKSNRFGASCRVQRMDHKHSPGSDLSPVERAPR